MEFRLTLRRPRQFGRWCDALPAGDRTRVDARLEEMMLARFGDSRSLGEGLLESRWTNGLRIYYSRKRISAERHRKSAPSKRTL